MDYAFPKFMGKALSQAKYLPLLFGFPIILLLLLLGVNGIPSGPVLFREFLPYLYVDLAAVIFSLLVLVAIIVGVKRFWRSLNEGSTKSPAASLSGIEFVRSNILPVVVKVLKHEKFSDCEANKIRYYGHLAIFYGFGLCFLTVVRISVAPMVTL